MPFEHYELLETLGSGSMGTVYRARDRRSSQDVAIKVLNRTDATARILFEQEYWNLRHLEHPGLVPVSEYGDGTRPFYAMELVEGADTPVFATWPLERVRALLTGLQPILDYLHRQGLVHGDIKPQNLRQDSRDRLRLLDLGLLRRAGAAGVQAGTIAYMAPEVIRGEPSDPRSDLYATAIVAYQLLAGRGPFDVDAPLAIVQAHLGSSPIPLRNLRPDVPEEIAQALERSLAKDPRQRPASAGTWLEALGWGKRERGRSLLFGSPILGRDREIAELGEHLSGNVRGARRAVYLCGEPGTGKSRLLREIIRTVRDRGERVLALTGRGDGPHAFVSSVLSSVEPLLEEAGLSVVDAAWAPLRAIRPQWGDPPREVEPDVQEARLRQSLCTLFEAISTHPLVVAVDDWDQVDPASIALLDSLFSNLPQRVALLLVQQADPGSGVPKVVLAPLPETAIRDFVDQALDAPSPAPLIALAMELSGGNPARLRAVMQAWQTRGALFVLEGEWHLDPALAHDVPRDLAMACTSAIEALGDEARDLAQAAAVLGQEVSLIELAAMVEFQIFAALQELERALLLERSAMGYRFIALSRDKVLMTLEPGRAAELHLRAAEALDRGGGRADRTRAAMHLVQAKAPGAPERALEAIRASLAVGAIPAAREQLSLLASLAMTAPEQLEHDRLLGDLSRIRGAGRDSLEFYDRAISLARTLGDMKALCRDLVSAGIAATLIPDHANACARLEEALELAEKTSDARQQARALAVLGRMDFFAGRTAQAVTRLEAARDLALAAGLPACLGDALGLLGVMRPPGDPEGRDLLARAAEVQRGLLNPVGLIEALINLGDRDMARGDLASAERAFEDARLISRQIGARSEEAFVCLNLAQVKLELGVPEATRELAESARTLAQEVGQAVPIGHAHALLALADLMLGAYGSARRSADLASRAAQQTHNRYLELSAIASQTEIALDIGDLERASDLIDGWLEIPSLDPLWEVQALLYRGSFLTLIGAFIDAQEAFTAACTRAEDAGARGATARILYARAYLAWASGDLETAADQAVRAIELAELLGAQLLVAKARWLLGRTLESDGKATEAEGLFSSVLTAAQDAGWELGVALASLGLSRTTAGAMAKAWKKRGRDAMRRLRTFAGTNGFFVWPERRTGDNPGAVSASSESLDDVFDILAEARQAESFEDLLARLLRHAIVALGAERGVLQAYREQQRYCHAASGFDDLQVADLDIDEVVFDLVGIFEEDRWILPVTGPTEAMGVLYLEAPGPARRLVPAICDAIGLAITHFDDYQRIADHLDRLGFSDALARELLSVDSPQDAFRKVLDTLLEKTAADRAAIVRFTPTGELETSYSSGMAAGVPQAQLPISRSICQWVASSGEPVRLLDAQSADSWRDQESIMALGLRTVAAHPIMCRGDVWGVLYLDSANILETFGPREQDLLKVAADVLSPFLVKIAV